jgi:peptide/nickel transport system substrate-binding protein
MKANITSLDPAFSKYNLIYICNHIFNGLLQLDEKLNIQPDIANLDYFSWCKNLYFYVAKGHLFSKAHFIW